jgi:serpin B
MAKTLRLPVKGDRLHTAFADLSERLLRPGKPRAGQLLVANSLWGQRGYPFRDKFLRLTRDDYHAELREVDFQGDAEGARQDINRWVEYQTQKMIKELLKPRTLDKQSRLVLVNAIYFRSLWWKPFLTDQTKEASFHTAAGESVRVPMMHVTDTFQYYEGDGVQVLEMPYQHKPLSMVVILPQTADGMAVMEAALTTAQVKKWLTKLTPHDVIVTLPKFTTTCGFELGRELLAMGMPIAFSDGADFSGISDQAISSDGCLNITTVPFSN